MKINILILGMIILTAGAWTYFSNTKVQTIPTTIEKVKNFEFEILKEGKAKLYDYQGRVILLHFWASWCAPCLEEFPELIELAKQNPDEVIIIAMAVQDKPQDIQKFMDKLDKETPKNFIIGLDPNKTISGTMYNTYKLPETYVITKQMSFYEHIKGAEDKWTKPEWKAKIKALSSL